MHVLVLGGTAFIGPHICAELVALGHRVTVFHRGRTAAPLDASVTRLRGDRRQLGAHLAELRALRPDVVVDMIAFARHDALDLLEVFAGHAGRAVVVSSCDVYRNFGGLIKIESHPPDPLPLTETAPLRQRHFPFRAQAAGPNDWAYDYDKIEVEAVLRAAESLPTCLVRMPMVYGEGDRQRRFAPYLRKALRGEPVVLGETLAGWRSSRGYVRNMAHAVVLAATHGSAPGRVYNVADPVTLTELELVKKLLAAAARRGVATAAPDPVVVPDADIPPPARFPGDPHYHMEVSDARIRAELGFTDVVGFDDALDRTVASELEALRGEA